MDLMPRHQCVVYDGSPAKMLPAIAAHIKEKLDHNMRCMYLNSPTMVAGIRSYLFAIGVNVTEEVAMRRLILTSDQSQVREGEFDADLMLARLEEEVNQALADGFDGLWATGDMTWEMGRDRSLKKLVDYEWRLNNLFQKYLQLSGLCQYHLGSLSTDMACNALISHPSIYVNQTLSRINPHYLPSAEPTEPMVDSAVLQQTVHNLCALQPIGNPETR
jgi:hypothetical protein